MHQRSHWSQVAEVVRSRTPVRRLSALFDRTLAGVGARNI